MWFPRFPRLLSRRAAIAAISRFELYREIVAIAASSCEQAGKSRKSHKWLKVELTCLINLSRFNDFKWFKLLSSTLSHLCDFHDFPACWQDGAAIATISRFGSNREIAAIAAPSCQQAGKSRKSHNWLKVELMEMIWIIWSHRNDSNLSTLSHLCDFRDFPACWQDGAAIAAISRFELYREIVAIAASSCQQAGKSRKSHKWSKIERRGRGKIGKIQPP